MSICLHTSNIWDIVLLVLPVIYMLISYELWIIIHYYPHISLCSPGACLAGLAWKFAWPSLYTQGGQPRS